jgi:hypothetical protein
MLGLFGDWQMNIGLLSRAALLMIAVNAWRASRQTPEANLYYARAVAGGDGQQQFVSFQFDLPYAWCVGVIGVEGEFVFAVAARRPDAIAGITRFASFVIEKITSKTHICK